MHKIHEVLRLYHQSQMSERAIASSLMLSRATVGKIITRECTFREIKQAIGGFAYHFWSKSMPKLKRYLKKGEIHPLKQVTNEKDQTNIRLTVKAIEGFVMCSCIAMGLLQLIAVQYSHRVHARFFRYLRTPSNFVVSEATVMVYLRKSIFRMIAHNPHLTITKIIHSKQITPDSDGDLLAS